MSAANALLRAIHARLAGDAVLTGLLGAGRIFDRLLPRALLPCVTIGEVESRDYSTATEKAEEHFLTLEIRAQAGGRRQALEIAARVKALVDAAALPLAGDAVLANLETLSLRSRREAGTPAFVADMRLRAVTE